MVKTVVKFLFALKANGTEYEKRIGCQISTAWTFSLIVHEYKRKFDWVSSDGCKKF